MRRALAAIAFLAVAACSPGGDDPRPVVAGSGPPVVLPGAPGESGTVATPGQTLGTYGADVSAADVRFAEGMVGHHRQALEMTGLVPDRSSNEQVKALAGRIDAAQQPEIGVMTGWLARLGREVPAGHAHMTGYGMASLDEMNQLRGARGEAFDRLFLKLMIRHHEGALRMAGGELQRRPRPAHDDLGHGHRLGPADRDRPDAVPPRRPQRPRMSSRSSRHGCRRLNSVRSLTWGNGTSGIGTPRNRHSGSHPSAHSKTSSRSAGIVARTSSLWRRKTSMQ